MAANITEQMELLADLLANPDINIVAQPSRGPRVVAVATLNDGQRIFSAVSIDLTNRVHVKTDYTEGI